MFCDITVGQPLFDQNSPGWGFRAMLTLTKRLDINGGFLVNGEGRIEGHEAKVRRHGGSAGVLKMMLSLRFPYVSLISFCFCWKRNKKMS